MRVLCIVIFLVSSNSYAQVNPKEIYIKSRPSVVLITTSNEKGQDLAQGSGFAIGDGTQIVTNFHVIDGAYAIRVKASDGTERKISTLLGFDKVRDLAILWSDMPLPALTIAQSKPVVGESIITIGNPKGLEASISQGIISGIRETIDSLYYQISAPISPGSSGGPIINEKGEVVAIATFTFKEGQNLNFGVPTLFVAPLAAKTEKIALSNLCKPAGSYNEFEAEYFRLWNVKLYGMAVDKGVEAIKAGDNDPQFVLLVGMCALQADRIEEAVTVLEHVISWNPPGQIQMQCWSLLIYGYGLQGKYGQALHAYSISGIFKQVNGNGLRQLYLMQILAGDLDGARETARRIAKVPEGLSWINSYESLTPAQKEDAAKRDVQSILRKMIREPEENGK